MGCFEVPGAQTVPRAELWAAVQVRRHMSGAALPAWTLRPDATYVHLPLAGQRDRQRLRTGGNGDLWQHLDIVEAECAGSWKSVKVAAHADLADIAAGRGKVADVVTNHLADSAARAAAVRMLEVSPAYEYIATWEQRTFAIARLLAVIEAWHWRQGGTPLRPVPPLLEFQVPSVQMARRDMRSLIQEQGHVLRVVGGRVCCARCRRQRGLARWKWWTTHRCEPKMGVAVAFSALKRSPEPPVAPDLSPAQLVGQPGPAPKRQRLASAGIDVPPGGLASAVQRRLAADSGDDMELALPLRPALPAVQPNSLAERRRLMAARQREIRHRASQSADAWQMAWDDAVPIVAAPKGLVLLGRACERT